MHHVAVSEDAGGEAAAGHAARLDTWKPETMSELDLTTGTENHDATIAIGGETVEDYEEMEGVIEAIAKVMGNNWAAGCGANRPGSRTEIHHAKRQPPLQFREPTHCWYI